MANDGFNGSTIKFPTTSDTEANLRSISFEETGNQIDVSNEDGSTMEYVAGTKDVSVTVEVTGVPTHTVGTTGSVTIAWFEGGTETLTKALLADRSSSGSFEEAITTSMTFVPTV